MTEATLTVRVPLKLTRRGGRKLVISPEGEQSQVLPQTRIDSTLVKALARAFRWKRMLESGQFATIGELAKRERISPSYMTRVLRLILLSPNIVEAILDGAPGMEVTLARLLDPFPASWDEQKDIFCST